MATFLKVTVTQFKPANHQRFFIFFHDSVTDLVSLIIKKTREVDCPGHLYISDVKTYLQLCSLSGLGILGDSICKNLTTRTSNSVTKNTTVYDEAFMQRNLCRYRKYSTYLKLLAEWILATG